MSHLRDVWKFQLNVSEALAFPEKSLGLVFPVVAGFPQSRKGEWRTRPQPVDWLREQLNPGKDTPDPGGGACGGGAGGGGGAPVRAPAEAQSWAGGSGTVGWRVCPGRAQPGVAHTPWCRVNQLPIRQRPEVEE